MEIIDIHVHPVCRRMVQDRRNLRILEHTSNCLEDDSAIPGLLARMDAGGISKACLMGPNCWDGMSLTNENVRCMVESHPNRFIGFLGVDPAAKDPAETKLEIRRAVDEWGYRGVGEIGGGDILASEWDVVYRSCIEQAIPVLVHVGIPLPSMLLKHSHPFLLDELAHRYPELSIIAAHVGVPWVLETLSVAFRHPNVYIDISALPAFNHEIVPPILALCIDRGLGDRIFFGSDFPVVDPCSYVDAIRAMRVPLALRWLLRLPKISEDFRRKLLSENAHRLLRLESPG